MPSWALRITPSKKWMSVCDEKGYVRPSVYQGQYNLLCRRCEDDLMPVLKKYGMAFNAYRYVHSTPLFIPHPCKTCL